MQADVGGAAHRGPFTITTGIAIATADTTFIKIAADVSTLIDIDISVTLDAQLVRFHQRIVKI